MPLDACQVVLRHPVRVDAGLVQDHVAPRRDGQDELEGNRPVVHVDDALEAPELLIHVVPSRRGDTAESRLLLLDEDRLQVSMDVGQEVDVLAGSNRGSKQQ